MFAGEGLFCLSLNQNSLLVKRQNDNTSPGKKSMHLKLYLSSYVSLVKQHLFIHSRYFINLKRQQSSEFCFMSNYNEKMSNYNEKIVF